MAGFVSAVRCSFGTSTKDAQVIPVLFDVVTLVLNAVLAIMISWKLQSARKRFVPPTSRLGDSGHFSARYLTTIGIVIESSLAWTLCGFLYTISRVMNSSAQEILESMFVISGVSQSLEYNLYQPKSPISQCTSIRVSALWF